MRECCSARVASNVGTSRAKRETIVHRKSRLVTP
jgi:hypothetical protein